MYLNLRKGVLLVFECEVVRATFKNIAHPKISRRGRKAKNVPGRKTYISFFSVIRSNKYSHLASYLDKRTEIKTFIHGKWYLF
jgi:hypothetical protein